MKYSSKYRIHGYAFSCADILLGWGELNQDLVEKPAFVLQMCSKLIPCLRNDVYSCLWIHWDCLEVPETSGWRQNNVNAKLTTSTRNLSRSVWGELFWVLVGGNGHLDLIQSSYKAYSPTSLSILSTPAKDISKLFLSFEKSGSHPRYTIVTDPNASWSIVRSQFASDPAARLSLPGN